MDLANKYHYTLKNKYFNQLKDITFNNKWSKEKMRLLLINIFNMVINMGSI